MRTLEIRGNLQTVYDDVLTPEVVSALHELAPLDDDRKAVMSNRIGRRMARARKKHRIEFLEADAYIPRTLIKVQDARDGAFVGSEIPADLQRQWIQGTGPAARPGAGGDGPPQHRVRAAVGRRRLDVRRRRRARPGVDDVARQPAQPQAGHSPRPGVHEGRRTGRRRNEPVGAGFFGRPIVDDWKTQLDFTTKIFRPRGLHLDDRHVRHGGGDGFSASIVDTTLYIVNNHEPLRSAGASLALYLPKIQTAEEAALWNDILSALEDAPRLDGRHHQGLRARRAARSVLPADGDPRRARQALRRLQYRPLGLHQQRVRCGGVGSRSSSIPTSTPSR